MACGSCGGKKSQTTAQEYLAKSRDAGEARFPDLPSVRRFLANNGGGTHQLVAKVVK